MRRTFAVAACVVLFGLSLVACSQPAAQSNDQHQSVAAPTDGVSAPSTAELSQGQSDEKDAPAAEEVAPRVVPHIALYPVDDTGANYALEYGDEVFDVYYEPDVWSVCQVLVDEHPIHGSDYESYRTAEDMAYEWEQHNLAYRLLPEDSPWRDSVSNVDLDPEDQGKSLQELYKGRMADE